MNALLGCWSYIDLADNMANVSSSFQPTKSVHNNLMQHQILSLLNKHGTLTTRHHKSQSKQTIYHGLHKQNHQWHQQGKEVLVRMDSNKNVNNLHAKIMCIFAKTDLIDLHHHQYQATPKLATYQRGQHPIDIKAGSNLLASALTHTWILPFAEPPTIKRRPSPPWT